MGLLLIYMIFGLPMFTNRLLSRWMINVDYFPWSIWQSNWKRRLRCGEPASTNSVKPVPVQEPQTTNKTSHNSTLTLFHFTHSHPVPPHTNSPLFPIGLLHHNINTTLNCSVAHPKQGERGLSALAPNLMIGPGGRVPIITWHIILKHTTREEEAKRVFTPPNIFPWK